MWHVSSRSGVATLQTVYTCYLLAYLPHTHTDRQTDTHSLHLHAAYYYVTSCSIWQQGGYAQQPPEIT